MAINSKEIGWDKSELVRMISKIQLERAIVESNVCLNKIIKNKHLIYNDYMIVVIGFIVVLGSIGFARLGFTMILPDMQQGLNLSSTEMGIIAAGNMVGYLLFSFVGGILAHKHHREPIIFLSLLVCGLAMVATGFSNSFQTAFIARLITGLGSGGSFVPMLSLAASYFPSNRRGMATGIIVGGSGLGLVFTGNLLPFLFLHSDDIGWRISWFILGVTVIIIAVIAQIYFSKKNCRAINIETSLNVDSQNNYKGIDGYNKLKWITILRLKTIWLLAFIYALFGFSYVIYYTFIVSYLVVERGFTATEAGSMWALVGIISVVSGFLWGLFSDVYGRKLSLHLIFTFQLISYLLISQTYIMEAYYLSAIMFGLTAWSIPGIMVAIMSDFLDYKLATSGMGFITLIFGVGQSLGPVVTGYIADAVSTLTPAFLLAAASAFLGCLATGYLKNVR